MIYDNIQIRTGWTVISVRIGSFIEHVNTCNIVYSCEFSRCQHVVVVVTTTVRPVSITF